MSELVVRRVSHEEAQQVIQTLTEPQSLKGEVKAGHLETLTLYQAQVKAEIKAPNPEQARRIEELSEQILKLRGELDSSAPKAELEAAQRDVERLTSEAEETGREHYGTLLKLRAELEKAQGEENPRVVELKLQLERLGSEKEEAVQGLQELQERQASSGETVPKASLEDAQARVRELEEQIEPLRADLEKALGEENPLVIELKGQMGRLEEAREEAVVQHGLAIKELEARVEELTLAAENHSRQIEDITRRAEGEAEKVEALQLEMRRYQEAAREVTILPHVEVAAKLDEAQRAHAAIDGETPQDEADKAFLAFKIELLTVKQEEHVAIQKNLQAAHQTGAREVLATPEFQLETQTQIFEELRRQMDVDAEALAIRGDQIPARLESVTQLREQARREREEMGDVSSKGAEEQLNALRIDQAIAKYDNELRMLTALQKTLQGFEEVGRGVAGESLSGLHRQATEALVAAREEHRRLDEVVDGRDEGAIAVQAEKVRGLEVQVESLRAAVESYQEHAATRVVLEAKFLQELIALVPEGSRGEATAYLRNAVQAIAAMQATLVGQYGAEKVAHAGIQKLLRDIHGWQEVCARTLGEIVLACQVDLGRDLNEQAPKIAGFVEQLARKHAEMERLLALPQDQIAAELVQAEQDYGHALAILTPLQEAVDGARDEDAIAAARLEVEFHAVKRQVLQTIQRNHHQPLEQKMGVIGTMQRLFFSFFSMLFSIPSVLLGGLQTIGSLVVSKPNE